MTDLQQVPSASSNPLVPSGSSSLKTSHSAASSKASGAKSNPPSKSSSRSGSGSGKIAESSGSGGVVKQPTRAPPAPAPRALPSHPKYRQMVVEAIRNLHDRSGSSRQAILKYIVHKYSVGENQKLVNNNVKLALCSAVKIGDLKQTKGVGASGSFKISSATSKIKGGQRKAGRPKKIVKPKKAAATKGKSPAKGAKRTPPKIKGGKKTALKKKPGVRKIVAAGPSTKGAGSKTKKPGSSKAKTAPKAKAASRK